MLSAARSSPYIASMYCIATIPPSSGGRLSDAYPHDVRDRSISTAQTPYLRRSADEGECRLSIVRQFAIAAAAFAVAAPRGRRCCDRDNHLNALFVLHTLGR